MSQQQEKQEHLPDGVGFLGSHGTAGARTVSRFVALVGLVAPAIKTLSIQ